MLQILFEQPVILSLATPQEVGGGGFLNSWRVIINVHKLCFKTKLVKWVDECLIRVLRLFQQYFTYLVRGKLNDLPNRRPSQSQNKPWANTTGFHELHLSLSTEIHYFIRNVNELCQKCQSGSPICHEENNIKSLDKNLKYGMSN